MKYFLILIIPIITISCTNTKSGYYAEYMKSGGDSSLVKEFTSYLSDTTMSRIFLRQSETEEDKISKTSYVFFVENGLPISSGIEYFYPDNSYELVANSLYELDQSANSIEVKANPIRGGRQSLKSNPVRYFLMYNFKLDSLLSMEIESEIFCKKQYIDSLKAKCLLINTVDKLSYNYGDSRKDTSEISRNLRLYEKGKGLTRFEYESNGVKSVYHLTNKYQR